MRKLCEKDQPCSVSKNLRRLDAETVAHPLDDAARVDYQTALDAYESAQRTVKRITDADEISKVTDTLSSGRYALACVQARVAGEPLPELRVPCFFNPQHGPSVMDVQFTPPGRGTRKVPACAMDAARLKAGEKPEIREVEIGGRRVPYFEAGAAYAPYGEGYFVGAVAVESMFSTPPPGGGPGDGFDGHGWDGHHGRRPRWGWLRRRRRRWRWRRVTASVGRVRFEQQLRQSARQPDPVRGRPRRQQGARDVRRGAGPGIVADDQPFVG